MDGAEQNEARIIKAHNVLVVLSPVNDQDMIEDFCGSVVTAQDLAAGGASVSGKTVYLCGELSGARDLAPALEAAARVFVVADRSHQEDHGLPWQTIDAGRVPLLVHGVGVLYRRLFDLDRDYFDRIRGEHAFQILTESTKPGRAHRTGIYLTPVERIGQQLHFRLLRCSTNLSGPTENFRATDRHIVDALNQEAACIFQGHAPLNHVLAQLYHNIAATEEQKQTKAKIKAHADKTKDMPVNAIMAFCTFYDRLDGLAPLPDDPFDRGHNKVSGLTRLVFRLKPQVAERPGNTLPSQFTVTLYPNSVFFVPMSTNRWYTHEIRPSMLDAAQVPTRLGYVVRCSATEAVHQDGHTLLSLPGGLQALQPPTPEGMAELRALYAEQNRTDAFIDYGDRFLFSMNEGDYLAPGYDPADEFRQYALPLAGDPFEELSASVRFEEVGRGRQGAVLVRPDEARGTPIVRTTTSYALPAQPFPPAYLRLARAIQRAASLPLECPAFARHPLAQISNGAGSLDGCSAARFRRRTWLARPVIPALARHPLAQIHGSGGLGWMKRCGFRRRTWLARLKCPAFARHPLAQISSGASDLAPPSAARFRRRTWLARLELEPLQQPQPQQLPHRRRVLHRIPGVDAHHHPVDGVALHAVQHLARSGGELAQPGGEIVG
jgi:hypothetical protein